MSSVQSGDAEGLSSWTLIDPNEAAAVQTPQDDKNVNDENEPLAKTENPQAVTTPPVQVTEKPEENEGILLTSLSQVESFVTEEHEQLTLSYTKEAETHASLEKEDTQDGEFGQERDGSGGGHCDGRDGGGAGTGGGGNSEDEDSDIVTLDQDVIEEVGPELPVPSGSAEATPSHEFVRITPMPDAAKLWEQSSSDESASPEVPAVLRHRRPSKRKSPRGERRWSANPAAQTSISLHGCIICVACVVIALAALKKFMAGDPQVAVPSPDLEAVPGDLKSLALSAPALQENKIPEIISSVVGDKGDVGTSFRTGDQPREAGNVAASDNVAALDNVAASDKTEGQKAIDLKELLIELQQLSNKVENLKITAVETPVTTEQGDGGIADSDVEIKRRIQAELEALADRLNRHFGAVGSKQDETAQRSELFHLEESLPDEPKDSQYETEIVTHIGDVKEMEQQSNESKNDPASESGVSGTIVEPIVNVDEAIGKERTHTEVHREKQQEPAHPKKPVPKKPKHKSSQGGGTFEKFKTKAKAFLQTQKETFKRAKKTISDQFQKIGDSFRSTFKRLKEKSKKFFEPKTGRGSDARSYKSTTTMNEPSIPKHKGKSKHKHDRAAEETKYDHRGGPGSKGGEDEAQKTNGRKTSGADTAVKQRDIVSAAEMLQILRGYLEQIGDFRHWSELESFLNQFYREGKYLRNEMGFEELVEAVQNYLEVLGYGKKVRAARSYLRDYVKQRAPVVHEAPPRSPVSQE